MKKLLNLLVCFGLAGLLLVGCNNGNNPQNPNQQQTQTTKQSKNLGKPDLSKEKVSSKFTEMPTALNDIAIYEAQKFINEQSKNTAISKNKLIQKLRRKDFTEEQAKYGVENSGIDFYLQAYKNAENECKKAHGISKKKLEEELKKQEFSDDEIAYALQYCTADWKQQAIKRAKSATEPDYAVPQSKPDLKETLIKYGLFTEEEAVYAIENANIDWLKQAKKHVNAVLNSKISADSYTTLKENMEQHKYDPKDIENALKTVTEDDWNKQAVKVANRYIKLKSSLFKSDTKAQAEKFMVENLKFTSEQAQYAIEHANWK